MSAWQAYKVMLLGLAVPTAAVTVEVGHDLFAPKAPISVTDEPTFTSAPPQNPTNTVEPAQFSRTSDPRPPAPTQPVMVLTGETPSILPAERPPIEDENRPGTASLPVNRLEQEAHGGESLPVDAGDPP